MLVYFCTVEKKKKHGPESLREVKKKREREYDNMKKTSNQTNREF